MQKEIRSILEQIRRKCPHCKILMMQPFTEGDDQAHMRDDLLRVQAIVDTLAEKYADDHRISKLILRPKYDLYGRAAPIKRNEIMVDNADEVLVIWDGVSKGTQYTVNYAKKKNKKLTVIETPPQS